jgi:hypothetical protein
VEILLLRLLTVFIMPAAPERIRVRPTRDRRAETNDSPRSKGIRNTGIPKKILMMDESITNLQQPL